MCIEKRYNVHELCECYKRKTRIFSSSFEKENMKKELIQEV